METLAIIDTKIARAHLQKSELILESTHVDKSIYFFIRGVIFLCKSLRWWDA